ncbi:MAG TPA: oligosaccharide flippase family protein [Anaerolineae bacterium]|nr:oligosaccharide flippase family protein [Anaerolineae bacterium]
MTESQESFPAKSSFASDIFKLAGGTVLAQVLGFLVAPFLTRLYSPEAFGTAAIFSAIVTLISLFACLRYEFAIMLPKRDEEAVNLLAVSLGAVVVVTTLTFLLIWPARHYIVQILNAPDLLPYLWWLPPVILSGGAFQALNYWNSRTKHFGRLSIARILASVTSLGTQVGVAVGGLTHAGGLIGGTALGSIASAISLAVQVWREDWKLFREHVRLSAMRAGLVRYRKFPLIDSWGSLINSLSWQLPTLMLSASFSQTIVGNYALTYRMIQFPMALVGNAMAQVFFQRASELYSKQEPIAEVVKTVFEWLVALGLFPALLLTVASREIFTVVFGPQWSEAGIYMQILSLWMFFWFIASPLSTVFTIVERQELALVVHSAILLTRIGALVMGGVLLKNVYIALGLFAGSGVIVYGGVTLWNMALAKVPLRTIGQILLCYTWYSLPALVLLASLKWLLKIPDGMLLIVIAIEILGYYSLLMHWKVSFRRSLQALLRPDQKEKA